MTGKHTGPMLVRISPPLRQSEALVEILAGLPKYADRCFLLDAIGFSGVGPLQYVDDTTIPLSTRN